MPTTDVAIIDFSDVPPLGDSQSVQPAWRFLVQDDVSLAVYRATQAQVKASLAPAPTTALLPTVSLLAAEVGTVNVPMSLVATALAPGGVVSRVEFFNGRFKIGQALTSPYSVDFIPNPDDEGLRYLTAKVTDSNGNSAVSAPRIVTVEGIFVAVNRPPVVTLELSALAGVLRVPVALKATAVDPDGVVAKVEFFNFSDKIGEANVPPYNFSYLPLEIGVYVFSAKATDNRAASATTPAISYTAQNAPVVVPPPTLAGAPTAVYGTAGSDSITVYATPPASTGGAAITGYAVYRNGSVTALATNVALPYLDATALNPTAYTYTVAAINSVGTGPQSTASVAVTPNPATVVAPSYHGNSQSPSPSPATVQAMVSEQWAFAPRTISYSANGTFPTFAEPASYGIRNIIFDKNPLDITGDISRTTQLYSINGLAVSYNVYTHFNPQYDAAFIISL